MDFSVWSKEVKPNHTQNISVVLYFLKTVGLCCIEQWAASSLLKLDQNFSTISIADKVVILCCPEFALISNSLVIEYQTEPKYSSLLRIVIWTFLSESCVTLQFCFCALVFACQSLTSGVYYVVFGRSPKISATSYLNEKVRCFWAEWLERQDRFKFFSSLDLRAALISK